MFHIFVHVNDDSFFFNILIPFLRKNEVFLASKQGIYFLPF
jgi:hypothetical protein